MLFVFDIDNTLYDFAASFAPITRSFVHIVAKHTNYDENVVSSALKAIYREHNTLDFQPKLQEFAKSHKLEQDEFETILKILSVSATQSRKKWEVAYEGVVETLREIHESGAHCIAFSNSPFYRLYQRLMHIGVADYFTGIICFEGAEVRTDYEDRKEKHAKTLDRMISRFSFCHLLPADHAKPHPEGFEVLRRRFRDPEMFMVGDSLESDLRPAKNCGFSTVWARYGTQLAPRDLATLLEYTPWSDKKIQQHNKTTFEPDHTIDHFSDLLEIVRLPKQGDLFRDE